MRLTTSWRSAEALIVLLKLLTNLLFEPSDLDAIEFCIWTKLFGVLLLGKFKQFSIKCSFLATFHFLLECFASFRVSARNVTTQRLACRKDLLTVDAGKSLIGINFPPLAFLHGLFHFGVLVHMVNHFLYR